MTTLDLLLPPPPPAAESLGAVYTRSWVTDLMLDLIGYRSETDLVSKRAVEPSCGQGAFLLPMVRRLLRSCRLQERPWLDCRPALRGYELDPDTAAYARQQVYAACREAGVPGEEAATLSSTWVVTADYLLAAKQNLRHTTAAARGLFDQEQGLEEIDFIVGNPPYVRLESIPAEANAQYRRLYPTMAARADLYVGFYEAALRQLRAGGVCAFICADRWMVNQYGQALRQFITRDFAVEVVVEMHRADAFEAEVDAYPAITVIRRVPQGGVVVASAHVGVEAATTAELVARLSPAGAQDLIQPSLPGLEVQYRHTWFCGSEPWPRVSPGRLALLQDLEERFPLLEDSGRGTKVKLGVATGADAIFMTTQADAVEPEQMLRLARPVDVRKGTLRWGGCWLVSPWHEGKPVDLMTRPRLRAYLEPFREQLEQRHIVRSGQCWYKTIDKVDEVLYRRPKLYIPDIKDTVFPVLDRGETYPDHNLYCIVSDEWDLEVLGALLLSEIGSFFVECYGVRMRGGYLRMQAQYLRKVRVPRPGMIATEQAEGLRQAFRDRNIALATQLAMTVYGITDLPK